jgi:hypothetical protein
MVLENKDLRDLYHIKPRGMSFASIEGREWKKAHNDKPILKEEDNDKIPRMAQSIAKHPDASSMLKQCLQWERAIICEMQGVKFKCRLDASTDAELGFVDIKTTTDARDSAFRKKVKEFHHDMQFELYGRLLALDAGFDTPPWFAWIVVEDKDPFAVECYTPIGRMLESGAEKLDRAIALYKKCRDENNWPAYAPGIHDLDYTDWQ